MTRQNEDKFMMVDLKYSMNKDALTFFTNSILGSFSLLASVYSEKNHRCPTISDYDFTFGEIETQIKIESIKSKIELNQMSDDKDFYLCIGVTAYLESKFTIEFTSE